MMHHKLLAIAGIAVLSFSLAACASSPDKKIAKNNRSQQVCFYRAQIGSHLGQRVCMSRSAYKARQKANQKQVQKNADMKSGGGGGR